MLECVECKLSLVSSGAGGLDLSLLGSDLLTHFGHNVGVERFAAPAGLEVSSVRLLRVVVSQVPWPASRAQT